MTDWTKLTHAEKIVWMFTVRVTDSHRRIIEKNLRLTEEQFERAIPRARDLGVEADLWLTPVYEREGWWTVRPTQRIVGIAVRESVRRQLGEAQRNARVYSQRFGEEIADVVNGVRGGLHGLENLVGGLQELRIGEGVDYLLAEIDAQVAKDPSRPFIAREGTR